MVIKEVQEKLVATLKRWQKIEDEAILSLREFIAATDNPLPRAIFGIIQRDAQTHREIQELLIQANDTRGFELTVDQMGDLSKVISRHVDVEKRMIAAAEETLDAIKGKKMVLHEYLLEYLQKDERKHMDLLRGLENIKKNM